MPTTPTSLREQLDGSTGTADYAKEQRDAAFWEARRTKIEQAAKAAATKHDHAPGQHPIEP